jgi:hypothetical protein
MSAEMARKITNREKIGPPSYGRVRSPGDLGRLASEERKYQGLTLNKVYSASGPCVKTAITRCVSPTTRNGWTRAGFQEKQPVIFDGR